MFKNRRLFKAISNIVWSDLASKIEYKANEKQVSISILDTYHPSSKTCSRCGSVKESLSLGERIYSCTECVFEEDRNINASINILNEVLRLARIEQCQTSIKN